MKRDIKFQTDALIEYQEWSTIDLKPFRKITKLLIETTRTPFEGTGHPEALKGNQSGLWSRRINQKDRLVYGVSEDTVTVISCKGHYDDK